MKNEDQDEALLCKMLKSSRWLMQERRNSSALAMELRLSCTNPSIGGC